MKIKKLEAYINAPAWPILGTMLTLIAAAQDTLIAEGSSVRVGVQSSSPLTTFHVRDTVFSKADS